MAFCKDAADVVLNICVGCGRRLTNLRPGVELSALILMWQDQQMDPTLHQDVEAGKKTDASSEATSTLFSPNSSVFNAKIYGFQVYRDFAGLSEAEYIQVVGKSPKDRKTQ